MKKIFFILLLIILTANGCYSAQKKSNLDLQARCATGAKEKADFLSNGGDGARERLRYENHYNKNLDKCYMLTNDTYTTSDYKHMTIRNDLWDVYENKHVAYCESYTGSPNLSVCGYNGISETYNLAKFNNFIKSYMNN